MFSDNGNISILNPLYHVTLKAADRFLHACPIKYDCRKLFVCLVELDFCKATNDVQVILQYPEKLDQKRFNDKSEIDFINNIKKFAFPYNSSLIENNNNKNDQKQSSALIKFYTFVFTDSNRIRLYGYCRSSQNGNRVLCLVSHLPWHSVYHSLLNKIASVINEKETSVLYNLLEGLYEYDLPEPGEMATVYSHDGQEQIQFVCPDRRDIPSINENRNLLKFFAFFDLNKLLKIFTALILERRILIVSKDIENLTACALALEYLIYPLEWFHAFAPILPEHIDLFLFYQPFPYIYGIHTSIYSKLNESQLNESVIILVDEREVLNCDKDQLPKSISHDIKKKLKFFQNNPQISDVSRNMGKYDLLLKTGPIRAFQEAVLEIIGNYRLYLNFDEKSQLFKVNDDLFYQQHDVSNSNKNDFYHEFRITQSFEEFIHDRADYLKEEKICKNQKYFSKDYIEYLFEQFYTGNNSFQNLIKSAGKKFELFRKQMVDNITEKTKDKQVVKKLFNGQNDSASNNINEEELSKTGVLNISEPIPKLTKPPKPIRPKKPILLHRVKPSVTITTVKQPQTDEIAKSITNDLEVLKRNTLVFDNIDNNNLVSNLSSRSSSISSNSSSNNNNNNMIDLNLTETITKDPTVCKYLNKIDHHNELVELFNNESMSSNTNSNNSSCLNDNPFVNDRFIDLFSIKKTFENIIINDDDDDDVASKNRSINIKTPKKENDILIANKTYNQSIIDLFDPIKSNSDTQSQNIITQQKSSLLLPKPFEQQQYSSLLVQHQQQQYYQPMSSSSSSRFPSYNQQQQQQQQSNPSAVHNSYLSYAATPFYGFNQRPQFGYHSVAYPITQKNDKLQTSNVVQQQQQQQQQQQTGSKSSLSFDNNNSLI